MQAGIEVGILARGAFPGGILVAAREWDEAVATTAALVADPTVPGIFEAAFEHAGARVRVDVLIRRGGASTFDLVEVKSAGRVREYHET